MTDRPIKRFVDVEIRKDTPSVAAAGFGIPLVITDNALLSTTRRVRRFTTLDSVGLFFGTSSEEYKAAAAYFSQDPFNTAQPEEILYGRYADASTAALLECGDSPETDVEVWKLVTDGEFSVDIDGSTVNATGLDFSSVTSLDDVATVIDTGLSGASCYYLVNRFNVKSDTTGATSTLTLLSTVAAPAGTDISGSAYLDGDVAVSASNPGGAVLSQGQVAETVAEAIDAIENINGTWYALSAVKKYRDTTDAEEMADEIEGRRKIFVLTTNDTNTLVLGSTSTFAYYLKSSGDTGRKRSAAFAYFADTDAYPAMSWLGQQLPKDIGSTNWAYRTLAGVEAGALVDIAPDNLTQAQIDAALDVNANVYTETLGAQFAYFGTMGGGRNQDRDGEYIDIIRNIDFLQARIEEGLLSLFLEREIVPYTDEGISLVDNRLKSLLKTYGIDQGILVDGTVVTSFPKRSEVSREDRDNRFLPDGTFTAELQGAINTVILRGTVYV